MTHREKRLSKEGAAAEWFTARTGQPHDAAQVVELTGSTCGDQIGTDLCGRRRDHPGDHRPYSYIDDQGRIWDTR